MASGVSVLQQPCKGSGLFNPCNRQSSTAIIDRDSTLSYVDLDRASNRLANFISGSLREQHAGNKRPRIGIFLDRCCQSVITMIAASKLGVAYILLDKALPLERVDFILKDSCATILVTDSASVGMLTSLFTGEIFNVESSLILAESDSAPAAIVKCNQEAYIVYTSGSTGQPKGVVLGKRALRNMVVHYVPTVGYNSKSVSLVVTSPSFDVYIMDIWHTLHAGGCLYLLPQDSSRDVQAIASLLGCATHLTATPTLLTQLLRADCKFQKGLTVVSLGEPLPLVIAKTLLAAGVELWNVYGPSETIAVTTVKILPGKAISIGTPLTNVAIAIVDGKFNSVPEGSVGELIIAGTCLAHGYVNLAELTRKRFELVDREIAETISRSAIHGVRSGADCKEQDVYQRWYHTGDLGRFVNKDGLREIVLNGRADDQIKIQGIRIELGEIEHVLSQHPQVSQAVALSVPPVQTSSISSKLPPKRLACVLRLKDDHDKAMTQKHVRVWCKRFLPVAMVPVYILRTNQDFPCTTSGKVDRVQLKTAICTLLRSESTNSSTSQATKGLVLLASSTVQLPTTRAERVVHQIFVSAIQQMLGTKTTLCVLDTILHFGLTSLDVTKCIQQIKHELGFTTVTVTFGQIFRAGNVREIAKLFETLPTSKPNTKGAVSPWPELEQSKPDRKSSGAYKPHRDVSIDSAPDVAVGRLHSNQNHTATEGSTNLADVLSLTALNNADEMLTDTISQLQHMSRSGLSRVRHSLAEGAGQPLLVNCSRLQDEIRKGLRDVAGAIDRLCANMADVAVAWQDSDVTTKVAEQSLSRARSHVSRQRSATDNSSNKKPWSLQVNSPAGWGNESSSTLSGDDNRRNGSVSKAFSASGVPPRAALSMVHANHAFCKAFDAPQALLDLNREEYRYRTAQILDHLLPELNQDLRRVCASLEPPGLATVKCRPDGQAYNKPLRVESVCRPSAGLSILLDFEDLSLLFLPSGERLTDTLQLYKYLRSYGIALSPGISFGFDRLVMAFCFAELGHDEVPLSDDLTARAAGFAKGRLIVREGWSRLQEAVVELVSNQGTYARAASPHLISASGIASGTDPLMTVCGVSHVTVRRYLHDRVRLSWREVCDHRGKLTHSGMNKLMRSHAQNVPFSNIGAWMRPDDTVTFSDNMRYCFEGKGGCCIVLNAAFALVVRWLGVSCRLVHAKSYGPFHFSLISNIEGEDAITDVGNHMPYFCPIPLSGKEVTETVTRNKFTFKVVDALSPICASFSIKRPPSGNHDKCVLMRPSIARDCKWQYGSLYVASTRTVSRNEIQRGGLLSPTSPFRAFLNVQRWSARGTLVGFNGGMTITDMGRSRAMSQTERNVYATDVFDDPVLGFVLEALQRDEC